MEQQQIALQIALALRKIAWDGKVMENEVPLIDQLAASMYRRQPATPLPPTAGAGEPEWIRIGRTMIGQREIKGPKHNSWIAGIWQRIGTPWFKDDETPWCAGFVADCLKAAGLPILPPAVVARALAWKDYGNACTPRVGCIGVKGRTGGGHAFFIIGETPDKRFYKVLEGNADDMVRIGDIPKSVVIATRWPSGVPIGNAGLPSYPPGPVSRSEA